MNRLGRLTCNMLVGLVCIVASVGPAAAVSTSYVYSGTIDAVSIFDQSLPNLLGVNFDGSFVLDTVPGSGDLDSDISVGLYTLAANDFSVDVYAGGNTLSLAGGAGIAEITDSSGPADDKYLLQTDTQAGATATLNGGQVPYDFAQLVFQLYYPDSAIQSDAFIPPPDASWLPYSRLTVLFRNGDELQGAYSGRLTSFAAVPLPPGLALLAAGLGGLGLLGFKKRRNASGQSNDKAICSPVVA